MAQHGGKREGAGRTPGAKTKARKVEIVSLADAAKEHAATALKTLAEICTNGTTDSARVAAANALLDRGYGKPRQEIDHSSTDGTMTPLTGFVLEVMDEAEIQGDETAAGLPN